MRNEPVPAELQDGAELLTLLRFGPVRPTMAEYMELPHHAVKDMELVESVAEQVADARRRPGGK